MLEITSDWLQLSHLGPSASLSNWELFSWFRMFLPLRLACSILSNLSYSSRSAQISLRSWSFSLRNFLISDCPKKRLVGSLIFDFLLIQKRKIEFTSFYFRIYIYGAQSQFFIFIYRASRWFCVQSINKVKQIVNYSYGYKIY